MIYIRMGASLFYDIYCPNMDYIDQAIATEFFYPGSSIPYDSWRRLTKHMLRWKKRRQDQEVQVSTTPSSTPSPSPPSPSPSPSPSPPSPSLIH